MSYQVGEISTGLTATFSTPIGSGTRTATVAGVAATISSSTPSSITLSAIPPSGSEVLVTLTDHGSSTYLVCE